MNCWNFFWKIVIFIRIIATHNYWNHWFVVFSNRINFNFFFQRKLNFLYFIFLLIFEYFKNLCVNIFSNHHFKSKVSDQRLYIFIQLWFPSFYSIHFPNFFIFDFLFHFSFKQNEWFLYFFWLLLVLFKLFWNLKVQIRLFMLLS